MHHVREKVSSVRVSLVRVRLALPEMDTIVHKVLVSQYTHCMDIAKSLVLYDKRQHPYKKVIVTIHPSVKSTAQLFQLAGAKQPKGVMWEIIQ